MNKWLRRCLGIQHDHDHFETAMRLLQHEIRELRAEVTRLQIAQHWHDKHAHLATDAFELR